MVVSAWALEPDCWGQIQAPMLTSWVTSEKQHSYSVPQFLHL